MSKKSLRSFKNAVMNLKLSEQTFQFSCYVTPEESKGGLELAQ